MSATGQHGLCWAHDPANADRRRRTASRGGRGKASKEVRDLKAEIQDRLQEIKAGELDRNDAAVMFQGYRALLEYIKLERAVLLEDDLAVRIQELERGQRPHAS